MLWEFMRGAFGMLHISTTGEGCLILQQSHGQGATAWGLKGIFLVRKRDRVDLNNFRLECFEKRMWFLMLSLSLLHFEAGTGERIPNSNLRPDFDSKN